jgi:hypothetical protein
MNRRTFAAEPETRIGICCGCNTWNLPLFKVPGIYRYRCAPCLRAETGSDHPECRRVFSVGRAIRSDAGGPLCVAIDQFGIESGDTPSYDGAAVAQRCDELNARQLQPINDGTRPCQCGHRGGLLPYCFEKGGGQLLPGHRCKLRTITPSIAP